jgi:hypothetical protein
MADLTNTLLANTKQYADTLYHLASQKNSKLEETVSKVSMTTNKEFFDRIGDVEFSPIISLQVQLLYLIVKLLLMLVET